MNSLRYRFIVSGSKLHFRKNVTFFFLLPFFLFLSDISYAQNAERIPVVKDQLREQYTENDFQLFLEKERNGEIPEQGGSVYSPAAADALANNNTGATATSQFTQSETSILAFGNNILIGFNDSGSLTGGANKFTGFSYSSNGGISFTDGGTLPTNAGGDAGDPVLARNETTGRIYFSTLGYTASTIQVFRSDDNGINWTAPVNGTPGGNTEDKQWIAVDNFPGAGNGNVYLISRRFAGTQGIYFFRSTDHGGTYTPNGGTAIVTAGTMQGAFVAVGTDHSIYVFWYAGTTLQMRRSTDQGLSFATAVTVATGLVGGINGDLGLTGTRNGTAVALAFRSNEFPHAAVNPVNGHIYITYSNDAAGADKADIFLVTSTNSGATWSAPQRVNDDATTTDQWQPTIAVTPDGYNIGIFYYSRQEDAANNLFKYYGRTGTISGSTITFSPGFAISDVASLPEFGRDAVVNTTYMGDYNHASGTPGKFHVVWSDNRADLSGGAPLKDPNVYYESINVALPPISQYLVWEGALGGQDYSGLYIKNFLLGKGYTVDYTSVFPASLTGYNGVFLSFGNYGSTGTNTVFTAPMAAAVQSYLEGGGKVYLEGGDALEFDQGANAALHALFGIGDGDDGLTNAIDNLQGQAGALTNGMLFNSSTQVQNGYVDIYVPTTGSLAFVESGYGNVAVQHAGTYGQRTFCFSYALAALNDGALESTKNEMLTKILSFFDSPAQVPDINVSPLSLSFSIPVGGTDSDILTITNQGNASLNWNIYEENVFAKIRLKDGREMPVKIQPKFDWKQPVKGEYNLTLTPQAPNYPGTDVYSSMGGNYLSSPALAGPECSGGLINDDGSVENGYRWNSVAEVRFVSRFDPPSYPYDLGKVCLAWTQDGSDPSISYNIVVYDDDGPGGTPGTLLAVIPASSAGVPAWPGFTFYDVNVAGLVPEITSGRVYIGASWNTITDGSFFLCSDETPTNMVHPGYMYYGSWLPVQNNFPNYKAMFIRAEQESSSIPWITESPVSGTIAAGSFIDVTISVDAAGLTPGNYLCQLIISSNDPYEPEVVVPISMEVLQSQFLVFEGVLGGQDYSGAYINNFLTGLGYTVDYTSVFPTTLIGYDAAFLSFGNYGNGGGNNTVFSAPMAAAVQAYLEVGGKIYLEGGDALEFDQAPNAALHTLFGLGIGSDGATNVIDGLLGQVGAITDGMVFTGSTQAANGYIDIYLPSTGATAFNESGYGNVAVQYSGTYGQKTFCFSYALAYLTDAGFPSTKQQLIANIFNFLTGLSLPPEINVSPASLSFTLPSGGVDSDILTISNTGLGNLMYLINERDPSVVLRTQDGKELPVTIQPKFEWKQPVKGKGWVPPAPSVTKAPADGNKLFSYESSGDFLPLGNTAYSHHNGQNFVQFDLGIPQVLNPVAPMTNAFWAADYGTDLTFAYAVNQTTNQFVRINKTTGAETVIGSCAPPHANEIFTGMGIDLNTNIIYLSGTDISTTWLYTVNPATGSLSQIGTVTNAQCIIAIAIDNDGILYGYDMNYDVMLTINKTTCAGIVLGPIGFNASYGQGMDFDPATGELYLAAFNNLTFKGELRIANKVTGNTTYLGDLGSTLPGGTGTIQLGWLGIPGQKFDCTWLTEAPVSGTITANGNQVVTVSVNATGLTAGTYNCNLVIISNDSNEPETIIPVTLTVTNPPDINVTPSSLTFTIPEGSNETKVLNIANTAPAGYEDLNWMLYEGSAPSGIVLKINGGQEIPVKLEMTQSSQNKLTSGSSASSPEMAASVNSEALAIKDNLAVLYDQTDNPGSAITSQNFESVNDPFDTFAADDFVVTGGSWLIESIDIPGVYFPGSTGPASSVNIWFCSNTGNLPGSIIYTALNIVPEAGFGTGSFSVDLPLPAVLPNGHYWMVIQVNMNYSPYGQWGWTERNVQSFNPSAWKNPGSGFGTSCTNWGYRLASCVVGSDPDLCFRLNGVVTTGVEWLSENPVSGTIAAAGNQNINVTANTAGLTVGTYNCTLLIYSNDPDESPVSIPVIFNVTPGTVTANYNVLAGWNMISLPLTVSNSNYLILFPTAVPNTLFGFSGGYFQTTSVANNIGYWLKFPGPLSIPVQGTAITNSPITLTAGWNMIGGPNCNVPLANISDPGNIIIPGTLYAFSGGYISATSVDPTKGYWVKANGPGTININCTATLAKSGGDLTIPAGVFDPFTKIYISDAADNKQTLYFDGKLDGIVDIESFSLPPAAPAGSFDARLSGEYILSESDEVSIYVQSADYPVSIKVTNLKPEEGYKYTLKEMAGSQLVQEHIVTEGSEILVSDKEVKFLILTKGNTIPSSFDLAQNYPNPFNPTTLIKYTLPEAREVSLIIYNSLGEKIKTLVSGIREAGYYTVTWDATNDYGRNVGSGTYLYSLHAGDYHSVKKMILVK